ncbi:hypothetical protein RJT34_16298 [Clitoria ternatea]|uniref:Uncharacterized protein n=1 Tax=Clitoria ternatea TaxID=43366 RepID=A0AAN9PC69_CLITE
MLGSTTARKVALAMSPLTVSAARDSVFFSSEKLDEKEEKSLLLRSKEYDYQDLCLSHIRSLAVTRATYSSAPRAVVLPEALHSDLGRTRQDIRAAKGIGLRAEQMWKMLVFKEEKVTLTRDCQHLQMP